MSDIQTNIDIKFNSSAARKLSDSHISEKLNTELNDLLELCYEKLPSVNEKLIKKAFILCVDANSDRIRRSGEPSYYHNIEVAKIAINDIHLDDVSVAVALIYNVHTRENYTIKTIRSEFGQTISSLIEGLDKIRTLENSRTLETNHLENFRKLLLSLSTDVRIILIKLAIRLHNMRTLKYLSFEKQKEVAHETMEVYVPFSNRFGLRNVKWELEDLSFKHTNPKAYQDIKNRLAATRKEREDYIKRFLRPVKKLLSNDDYLNRNNIEYEINGRVKHIYSIFNKMKARGKPMEELFDLVAMRVIIKSNDSNVCFYVYSLIASIYPPIPETFKDYIHAPKKNGYQSIHTALLGPQKKPVELQIRTELMHDYAEEGMAAHFNYKRGLLPAESVFDDANVNAWLDSVKSLFENAGTLSEAELMDSLKKNLFFEEIHVFTPDNEMLTFPIDATPLDFAFEIHSDIGKHCIGAKVNGKPVPLDYRLQSGDQVEVLTSKHHLPEEDWLKMVITPKAKSVINRHLKYVRRKKREEGQSQWEMIIKKESLSLNEMQFKDLYKSMNYSSKGDFFIDITNGILLPDKIMDFIKFKIDHGFSRSRPIIEKDLPHTENIIINGEDSDGLISEIILTITRSDNVFVKAVNYENFTNKFEAKITLELPGQLRVKQLFPDIYKLQGINSIRRVI